MLNIRKGFFTQSVAGHWNKFPREVVMTPSLVDLKKNCNTLSETLCDFLGGPVKDQDLDSTSIVSPFQLWIFCDSVTGISSH